MMYTQLSIGADVDFSVIDPTLTHMQIETDLRFMGGGVTTGTQFKLFKKGLMEVFLGIQYRASSFEVQGTIDVASLPPSQGHIPDITKPFNIVSGLSFSYYLFD